MLQYVDSFFVFLSYINWPSIGTCVTAIATVVLAILTYINVKITGEMLKAYHAPNVIITVVHDEMRPSIFQLVVRNIGAGVAYDISFEFSRQLPAKAWGFNEENAKKPEIMQKGPLIDGIPVLGPGETRKIDWGQFGGLKAALKDDIVTAICKYKGRDNRDMEPNECPLEIKSYINTPAVGDPQIRLKKANANHLKGIAITLDKMYKMLDKMYKMLNDK